MWSFFFFVNRKDLFGNCLDLINTSLFYELKKRIGAKYENVEVIISPQNPKYQYILRDNNTVLVLELDDKKNLFLEYYDRKLGRQQRDAGDF